MHIACNRLTMSASLSLSPFPPFRGRGVATPAAAAFCKLAAAGLGAAGCCCLRSRSRSAAPGDDFSAPGSDLEGFGACPFTCPCAPWECPGTGERRSRVVLVVFARVSWSGVLGGLCCGSRCDVERSSVGVSGAGGGGAGRYDDGDDVCDGGCAPAGRFGGGGAERFHIKALAAQRATKVTNTHRILEVLFYKATGLRGDCHSLRGGYRSHLVPNRSLATSLLVKLDNFHDRLRVLLLVRLGNATLLEELLPFLRKTGELAGRRVETDVCKVDGIVRRADLGTLRAVEEIGHEVKHALLRLRRRRTTA